MFETVELGRKVGKAEYEEQVPALRQRLLDLQQKLRGADFPVLVVFGGVDGAGKSEMANLLAEWMDPRWIVTRAYEEPTEEERGRPRFWRFWRDLPARGQLGMFLSAWYSQPLLRRVYGGHQAEFEEALEDVAAFEEMLAADGALIVKFWMHLGKAQQKKRFRTLEKDPLTAWRVSERDWAHWEAYEEFVAAAETLISHTSTGEAPWHLVEGKDARYRSLEVGRLLAEALEDRLARPRISGGGQPMEACDEEAAEPVTILSTLEQPEPLEKSQYRRLLKERQGRLAQLSRRARELKRSAVLVFEGPDAGGKGGAIRRLTAALDARNVQVQPIAAPTDEEFAHHYLWRFWRHLPRAGRFLVFDRSWYGRVLVERVEGFATEDEWKRAYNEIRHFERQLLQHGTVLVKFWLHVTKDEQLRRFKEREVTPWKQWKITDEDYRNRAKWNAYLTSVHDMVQRTSTREAPWRLVPGNDKKTARLEVLRHVTEALEASLEGA